MGPLRVAVVGLGIGALHADGYHRLPDDFTVVVVADPDPERVAFVQEIAPGSEAASSLDEVLARDDVDIVSLATPPFLHLDQVTAAHRAGKDVVCEKPLVGSLADLDRVAESERETGRWTMPIFQYRYGRGLQKLRHLQSSGVAGRLHSASLEVAWRRRADYYAVPWRGRRETELGGLLLSHCVHALDSLTQVAGPVDRAFARTSTRVNDIETEDCASVSLALVDGSFATLSATLGSAAEISRSRFCFERLSAESGTEPYANNLDPWTFVGDSEQDTAAIDATLATFEPGPQMYKGQFAALAQALRTGGDLPVTLADARASLELITALYWSAHTGEDVALPLSPDHPFYAGWNP